MPSTLNRLGAPDSRSLVGMLSRGAANYGSSMSANGYQRAAMSMSGDNGFATAPEQANTLPQTSVPNNFVAAPQPGANIPGQFNPVPGPAQTAPQNTTLPQTGVATPNTAPQNTTLPQTGVATPNASPQITTLPETGTAIGSGAGGVNPTTGAPITNIGNSGVTDTDFDYWSKINNIFRDTSQLDSNANLQVDRTKSDLASAYDSAARNYKQSKNATKNNYANNGLLYSGGYVESQATNAENYSRNTQNITQSGQRTFEDLTRQTVERKNLMAQQKLDIERQQAQAKANEDLRKSLIEAQTAAYANLRSSLTTAPGSSGTVQTPTGPTEIGGVELGHNVTRGANGVYDLTHYWDGY